MKRAYTLAEVIIVMLIIAVIAGVSIKVTKNKLNKVTSILYYQAYSTLKTVTSNLIIEFNANEYNDKNYTDPNASLLEKDSIFAKLKRILFQSAFADEYDPYDLYDPYDDPYDDQYDDDQYGGNEPDDDRTGEDCDSNAASPSGYLCIDGKLVSEAKYSECAEQSGKEWYGGACQKLRTTIPRYGKVLCLKFANYLNTIQNNSQCEGSELNEIGITDFSEYKPDLILRNGQAIYNLHKNPFKINGLAGIGKGTTGIEFKTDNLLITNSNEYGYVLYVDIDGVKNGSSKLWEDVFPFYLTLSGLLIPAVGPNGEGGDDVSYLQLSVKKISPEPAEWIVKSKSFKESACKSGYIPDGNNCQYCGTGNVYTLDAKCAQEGSDCKLKIVVPMKVLK